MSNRVIVYAVQTCRSHPAQWDTWTADGEYLYLRFRHGFGFASTRRGGSLNLGDETTVARFEAPHLGSEIELDEFCLRADLGLALDAPVKAAQCGYTTAAMEIELSCRSVEGVAEAVEQLEAADAAMRQRKDGVC